MTDRKLFNEVFNNLSARYKRLSMTGTIVCYDGREMFNTDGYNLGYNLYRLTNILNICQHHLTEEWRSREITTQPDSNAQMNVVILR